MKQTLPHHISFCTVVGATDANEVPTATWATSLHQFALVVEGQALGQQRIVVAH